MADPVTITHQESWRRPIWAKHLPSRPAWFVACADHAWIGKDNEGNPWGYATVGIARGVATRHRRAYHDGL